jgi:hypothetical protein
LFWPRHRSQLFLAAVVIFWVAAINAARRLRLEHSKGH